MNTELQLCDRKVRIFGNERSEKRVIHITGEHEIDQVKAVADSVLSVCDALFLAYPVNNWNEELSPWEAEAVFGNERFGSGAEKTLENIVNVLLPEAESTFPTNKAEYYLSGYSLAGLFALWSAYKTELFCGTAAVSPSVWFPGFIEFAEANDVRCQKIYLSLGDREEKVKSKPLSSVGDAIRKEYALLDKAGVNCTLEWNKGNHFSDFAKRTANGITWILSK